MDSIGCCDDITADTRKRAAARSILKMRHNGVASYFQISQHMTETYRRRTQPRLDGSEQQHL